MDFAQNRAIDPESDRWVGHPQGVPGLAPTRSGAHLFYQVVEGQGPAVVFEAGLASTRSIWGLVQPVVGRSARAVVYDRAGMGRSSAAEGSRRLTVLAEDLNDLLDFLEKEHGEDDGFILVAHSWGGPIARMAAAMRPRRIRGIVLIDPADEDCDVYYSPMNERSNRLQSRLFPPLARIGILRHVYGLTVGALPPAVRADSRKEMYTPQAVATQIAESTEMVADLRQMQTSAIDVPGIPMVIVSGGKNSGVGAEARRQLLEAHRARIEHVERGRHVIAENSGHLVMLSEPDVVVSEVERMLRLTRERD